MHAGNFNIFFGEMSVQDLCPTFNYIIFSYWIVGDLYYVFWVYPLIGRDFFFSPLIVSFVMWKFVGLGLGASWAVKHCCLSLTAWVQMQSAVSLRLLWQVGVEPREALEVFRLVNRIRYMYSGEQEVRPWIKQSGRWGPDTWGQHPSL